MLLSSPLVVMASKARSCPSGGTKQIPAISLTASTITAGRDGTKERARSVSASRCSNSFFKPTLLLEMAFRQRMHSCWTLSHLASLYNHITSWEACPYGARDKQPVAECKNAYALPSVAFVEDGQNLIQTLADKVVDPGERVVGQGDPQWLHARVNLVDAQVRIAQIDDVILRRIESIPVFLHGHLSKK